MLVLISRSGPNNDLTCSRQMWDRQVIESRGRRKEKKEIIKTAVIQSLLQISKSKHAIYILSWYQNADSVAKSSLPVFDPEHVSKRGTESTSLQTLAGNSTPHCLPVQT